MLILPLVCTMIREANFLLTGSALSYSADLLGWGHPIWHFWAFFQFWIHISDTAGVSPAVSAKVKARAGFPQDTGQTGVSLWSILCCSPSAVWSLPFHFAGCHGWPESQPLLCGVTHIRICCSDPVTSINHVCFLWHWFFVFSHSATGQIMVNYLLCASYFARW